MGRDISNNRLKPGEKERLFIQTWLKLEAKTAKQGEDLSTPERVRWGQKVIVVASDEVTAEGYVNYQNARPDQFSEGYIYTHARSVVDIKGLRPPHVARVDTFGRWWKDRSDEFVREVERIQGECASYKERAAKG